MVGADGPFPHARVFARDERAARRARRVAAVSLYTRDRWTDPRYLLSDERRAPLKERRRASRRDRMAEAPEVAWHAPRPDGRRPATTRPPCRLGRKHRSRAKLYEATRPKGSPGPGRQAQRHPGRGRWGADAVSQAFDPGSPEFAADPYPVYADLRAHSPVHYIESVQWWWVTRYRDVAQALGDRRFGKAQPQTAADAGGEGSAPPPPAFQRLTDLPPQMLESDPPTHTRLRALVSRAFTPTVVESLRPRIAALAADAVARMAEMDEADVVRDFAFPIPVTIIAELLGVPLEDQERFREWSNTFVRALDVTQQRIPGVREAAMQATAALFDTSGRWSPSGGRARAATSSPGSSRPTNARTASVSVKSSPRASCSLWRATKPPRDC